MYFIDTSVVVALALGSEASSNAARRRLEQLHAEELVVDTIIATESFLVLRSKLGTDTAREAVEHLLRSYEYRMVSARVLHQALLGVDGLRFGDAAIVEHARSAGAKLLTLDAKQAAALGPDGILLTKET